MFSIPNSLLCCFEFNWCWTRRRWSATLLLVVVVFLFHFIWFSALVVWIQFCNSLCSLSHCKCVATRNSTMQKSFCVCRIYDALWMEYVNGCRLMLLFLSPPSLLLKSLFSLSLSSHIVVSSILIFLSVLKYSLFVFITTFLHFIYNKSHIVCPYLWNVPLLFNFINSTNHMCALSMSL